MKVQFKKMSKEIVFLDEILTSLQALKDFLADDEALEAGCILGALMNSLCNKLDKSLEEKEYEEIQDEECEEECEDGTEEEEGDRPKRGYFDLCEQIDELKKDLKQYEQENKILESLNKKTLEIMKDLYNKDQIHHTQRDSIRVFLLLTHKFEDGLDGRIKSTNYEK